MENKDILMELEIIVSQIDEAQSKAYDNVLDLEDDEAGVRYSILELLGNIGQCVVDLEGLTNKINHKEENQNG